MPSASGSSGPTTVRPMFSFLAKRMSLSKSLASMGTLTPSLGGAGVAGGAEDLLDARRLGQLPDQGVLAAALADDQDLHAAPSPAHSGGGHRAAARPGDLPGPGHFKGRETARMVRALPNVPTGGRVIRRRGWAGKSSSQGRCASRCWRTGCVSCRVRHTPGSLRSRFTQRRRESSFHRDPRAKIQYGSGRGEGDTRACPLSGPHTWVVGRSCSPRAGSRPRCLPGQSERPLRGPLKRTTCLFRQPCRGPGDDLSSADRVLLLRLQQALRYFLDNQAPGGLVLDRQAQPRPPASARPVQHGRHRHGPHRPGPGGRAPLPAVNAAGRRPSRPGRPPGPHGLPHDHGVLPHFVDSATGAVSGRTASARSKPPGWPPGRCGRRPSCATPSWRRLAARLYGRIDWRYWADPEGTGAPACCATARMRTAASCPAAGTGSTARRPSCTCWPPGRRRGGPSPAASWRALRPFYGTVAGLRFNNADLGLFVFQYGLDLLDLRRVAAAGRRRSVGRGRVATPGQPARLPRGCGPVHHLPPLLGALGRGRARRPSAPDRYRDYSPAGPIDGTAHLTASLASVAHGPGAVLENLREAEHDRQLGARGRYGLEQRQPGPPLGRPGHGRHRRGGRRPGPGQLPDGRPGPARLPRPALRPPGDERFGFTARPCPAGLAPRFRPPHGWHRDRTALHPRKDRRVVGGSPDPTAGLRVCKRESCGRGHVHRGAGALASALEERGHVGPELLPGLPLGLGQLGQRLGVPHARQVGVALPVLEHLAPFRPLLGVLGVAFP